MCSYGLLKIILLFYASSGVLELLADSLPETVLNAIDSSEMVLVPGGPFTFGISKKQKDSILEILNDPKLPLFDMEFDSSTQIVPSFYMDKYEVTNKQYRLFLTSSGKNKIPDDTAAVPDLPVTGIGWNDASLYAQWAGKRLPTEKEWEKAARGTDGRIWPWGNTPSGKNYNGRSAGNFAPVKIGSFPSGASPYGLMDMAGNVYEMTSCLWDSSTHVMRGGCFLNSGAYSMTTFRWAAEDEKNGAVWLGFRCVAETTGVGNILNTRQ